MNESIREEKSNETISGKRVSQIEEEKAREEKKLKIYSNRIIFVFSVLVVISVLVPYAVTSWSWLELDVEKPNEIGDSVGGILGPCVGLIGAALTFLAFYAQIKANSEQRHQFRISLAQQQDALELQSDQFKKTLSQQEEALSQQKTQTELAKNDSNSQDRATRRERFANRFYMMLSVHRDNVSSIDIGRPRRRYSGRRAMISLYNELAFLYWQAVAYHSEYCGIEGNLPMSNEAVYQISYLSFFFGFGDISTPMVLDLVGEDLRGFAKLLHEHYEKIKSSKDFKLKTEVGLVVYENEYDLGTGHLRRLSHYFRHLYQTVKYVNDQDPNLLTYQQKYGYVSNLRAQLSVHEQLLLYYNSRSVLGKPWIDYDASKAESEGLLSKYCMIKSIPLNTANFYQKPEHYFQELNQEGKSMFEWSEIKRRIIEISNSQNPTSF